MAARGQVDGVPDFRADEVVELLNGSDELGHDCSLFSVQNSTHFALVPVVLIADVRDCTMKHWHWHQ
jgi:hypothetical protein